MLLYVKLNPRAGRGMVVGEERRLADKSGRGDCSSGSNKRVDCWDEASGREADEFTDRE